MVERKVNASQPFIEFSGHLSVAKRFLRRPLGLSYSCLGDSMSVEMHGPIINQTDVMVQMEDIRASAEKVSLKLSGGWNDYVNEKMDLFTRRGQFVGCIT